MKYIMNEQRSQNRGIFGTPQNKSQQNQPNLAKTEPLPLNRNQNQDPNRIPLANNTEIRQNCGVKFEQPTHIHKTGHHEHGN